MAEKKRNILKGYFDTGDIPTQGQYRDLIDSQLNLAETGTQTMSGSLIVSQSISTDSVSASGNIIAETITASAGIQVGSTSNINISPTIISNVDVYRFSGNQARLDSTMNHLVIQGNDGDGTKGNLIVANITASGHIKTGGNLHLSSSDNGHITASGNISASGTGSFSSLEVTGNTTVDGDVFISQYIRHTGDNDTHIEFLDNKIQLHAGNLPFITIDKDASTPFPLTINNGGNRINFRVMDRNTNLLLKTDSEAFKVNLYHAGNQKLETAAGGVNITGEITASGNISSSGNIIAETGSFDNSVILKAPNGNQFRFTINNSGHLSLTGSAV